MNVCLLSCFLLQDEKIIHFLNELKTILNKNDFELVVLSLSHQPTLNAPSIILPYLFKDFPNLNPPYDNTIASIDNATEDLVKTDIIFSGQDSKPFEDHYNGFHTCKKILERIIMTLKPSIGFTWGMSHPQARLLSTLLEENKIPVYIFERGLFTDTFMVEPVSVYGQSCLNMTPAIWTKWAMHEDTGIYNIIKEYYINNKPQKYSQNEYIPPDTLRKSLELEGQKIAVFWGQHDAWSGITPRETRRSNDLSPFFADTETAFRHVSEAIEKIPGVSLIFKPHPHDNNTYCNTAGRSTVITNDINNYSLFELADVFIAMLTTIQFEAVLYEKPIIVMANSQLKSKGIAYEYRDNIKLDELITKALNKFKYGKKLINSKKLVSGLFNDFLYGYDLNVPTRKKVADFGQFILENALQNQNNLDPSLIRSLCEDVITLPDKQIPFSEKPSSSHHKKASINSTARSQEVRFIAFYLPQFHPIPENDKWWGKGFTEWSNVAKARMLFHGHNQPQLPADLGFYDLRLPETRKAQAEMAREYGIDGFCYWHYWFSGKRLLDKPFQSVLQSGEPDFPFCLAWANETWSRRWLGEERAILIKQEYSEEDDYTHALWLLTAFRDERYIKVDNRPLFLIYRPKDLPNPNKTLNTIREICKRNGIENPYLVGIDAHCMNSDCRQLGFDDTLYFMPQLSYLPECMSDVASESKRQRNLKFGVDNPKLKIYDYKEAMDAMIAGLKKNEHPIIPSLFVGWDNTPRRGENGVIISNSSPHKFGQELQHLVEFVQNKDEKNRLIFINAWNEWAEGNHLEPDLQNGHSFLKEVKKVKSLIKSETKQPMENAIKESCLGHPKPVVRAIAFYLPQYYPIPENDIWWGKGFTEWSNVSKAEPVFPGHYQPHVPAELGYYDLRMLEARKAQADLAREYGIHGFCYYHYWFNGKILLDYPLQQVLKSVEPDFPFCLCWANENWTRAWDGKNSDILIKQNYSLDDDLNHIRHLAEIFKDHRYIKIEGKPLFIMYRASNLPDPLSTTSIWREEARKIGIGELFLCRVERFVEDMKDPRPLGFDAAIEFQPDGINLGRPLGIPEYKDNFVYEYEDMIKASLLKMKPTYLRFPCVCPSWDNSPRRQKNAVIFNHSTPELFEWWLKEVCKKISVFRPEERVVFINAFNEWGEGCHLEPDKKFGRAYLDATRKALITFDNGESDRSENESDPGLRHDSQGYYEISTPKAIDTKASSKPPVSIIIPVYNKVEYTRQCLEALIKNTPYDLYEVIIIDNASTDETHEFLTQLEGDIKIIKNETNKGFAVSCNQGAAEARSAYLLFLNNDTEPQNGWLQPLINVLDNDPAVGAVGSKLLFPDGTIQHAGVVIIEDNKLLDPLVARHLYYQQQSNMPAANQPRTYQALTAACILIRKESFKNVGGFDEGYWNGYEDVDLCFKLQENGWELVYQPESVVIHHESKSGIERFKSTDQNIKRLHERWIGKIKPDIIINKDGTSKDTDANRVQLYTLPTDVTLKIQPKVSHDSIQLISIIILTFNQLEYTKKCVESILKYTHVPHEIIIVDNGSKDGTGEYIKSLSEANDNITCIFNDENKGFARGNNQGITMAKGNYILLLNNDVVVTEHWLERLISHLELHPETGMVGPMTNAVSGPQLVENVTYGKDLKAMQKFAEDFSQVNIGRTTEVMRLVGFCLLMKKVVLDIIGSLDENYISGNFEDDDLCLRSFIAGFKNIIAHDVFIHHFGSMTFKGNAIDYNSTLVGNRQYFADKWRDIIDLTADGYTVHLTREKQLKKLLEWGEERLSSGDSGTALRVFERVLYMDRTNSQALNNLGVMQWQLGDPVSAIGTFQNALFINPGDTDAMGNLAQTAEETGRFDLINADLLDILKQEQPSNPDLVNFINAIQNSARHLTNSNSRNLRL
jgi:GT2 family glycosyltransferase/lipopolysaccharide biosynthesis protein